MRKLLFSTGLVISALNVSAPVLAAGVGGGASGPPTATVICGLSDRSVQQASGGIWVVTRANAFDTSGQRLCISAPANRPGFTILDNLRYTGNWQAYPFTGVGCAYWLCSHGTDLPRQVSRLPGWANTSFSWRGNGASGSWNASYDIWFDDSRQISTEDDGAELMIWLKPNTGLNSLYRWVSVGGRHYWFIHWRPCDRAGICWNYLQFRFPRMVHGVRWLHLVPFLRFLERQGLIRPSWWLTSVHAGYEIVSGGKGVTTTWFNAHV
jgi:hypothetical protein